MIERDKKGDIWSLVYRVKHHNFFERNKDDLKMEHLVDLFTAVLGGETLINTLTMEKLKSW